MPHVESPLRLPLVKQMLTDPMVRLVPRAIDTRWRSNKVIELSMTGFNPFVDAVCYPRGSRFSEWLKTPEESARRFNGNDRLMHDLLFSVHDYLHVWGTRLIQRLAPQIGFGRAPITRESLDAHAFCQLVSEAIATVGLDYWYLCTFDLNERLPIGTRFTGGLTVSYHERHLGEFRRGNPRLSVQDRAFFVELCRFYCSGELLGFDATDLQESPLLSSWLTHEIRYGQTQREISRRWFSYLSEDDLALGAKELGAPVACDAPWQARLMEEIADALWRKVKDDEVLSLPAAAGPIWRSPARKRPDLRFRNANALAEDALWDAVSSGGSAEQFDYGFCQILSQYDYEGFDRELMKWLPTVRERRDTALLRALLRGQPRLSPATEEPGDLLLMN